MEAYICHVSGFPELDEPPWGMNGAAPSFNICSCCGFTFGYEDCQLIAYEKNKHKWITSGAIWFDKELQPHGWSLDIQLKNIENIPLHLLPKYLRTKE